MLNYYFVKKNITSLCLVIVGVVGAHASDKTAIDDMQNIYDVALTRANVMVKPIEEAEKSYLNCKKDLENFISHRAEIIQNRARSIKNNFSTDLGICATAFMLGAYDPNDFVGNLNGFIVALRYPTLKALYLLEINPQAGNETYNIGKSTLTQTLDNSYADYSSHFGKSDKAKLRTCYFSLASDIKDFYISPVNFRSLFQPHCVKELGEENLKIVRILNTTNSIMENKSSTNEDKDFADKVKTVLKF